MPLLGLLLVPPADRGVWLTCHPRSSTSASRPTSVRPTGDRCHYRSSAYRCDLQMRDVPFYLESFVERHEGRYKDVQLPLPMRLV